MALSVAVTKAIKAEDQRFDIPSNEMYIPDTEFDMWLLQVLNKLDVERKRDFDPVEFSDMYVSGYLRANAALVKTRIQTIWEQMTALAQTEGLDPKMMVGYDAFSSSANVLKVTPLTDLPVKAVLPEPNKVLGALTFFKSYIIKLNGNTPIVYGAGLISFDDIFSTHPGASKSIESIKTLADLGAQAGWVNENFTLGSRSVAATHAAKMA